MHTCRGRRRRALAALVGAGLLAACSGSARGAHTTTSGAIVPGREWATTTPEAAGFDAARLDQIAARAEAAGSNCLVVIRHGRLVASWYWNGTDKTTSQDVFSATKSYASALVGIAQQHGVVDIHDPASMFIPQWQGTPSSAVTIEDLLSNDSGRHWDATTDYVTLLAVPDRTGFAIGLGQDAPPGRTWVYNNAAIQTLDAVLTKATGEDPAVYARHELLDPLGMAHSAMTHDAAGHTNLYFGLTSTCEDMARFGLLYIRRGNWDGTQIVPAEWVAASVGQPSQPMNAAYGYLWWLNRPGPVESSALHVFTAEQAASAPTTQLVLGAPDDMYWALGLGGQVIQIDPGSDTVVVRLAPAANTGYGPAQTAKVVTDALVRP